MTRAVTKIVIFNQRKLETADLWAKYLVSSYFRYTSRGKVFTGLLTAPIIRKIS